MIVITLIGALLAAFGFGTKAVDIDPNPGPIQPSDSNCQSEPDRCSSEQEQFKEIFISRSQGFNRTSSMTVKDPETISKWRSLLPKPLPPSFKQIECQGGSAYQVQFRAKILGNKSGPDSVQSLVPGTPTYTFDRCAVDKPGKSGMKPIPSSESFRRLANAIDSYFDDLDR